MISKHTHAFLRAIHDGKIDESNQNYVLQLLLELSELKTATEKAKELNISRQAVAKKDPVINAKSIKLY